MLIAEPLAGAADAGLDLIEEKQDFPFVAKGAQAGHEIGRGGNNPALALHGLAQNGDGGGRERRAHGIEVVELRQGEAGHEGLKSLLVLGLAGGGHGGEGPAVERVLHGDDLEPAVQGAPFAGELEEAFIGFGPGVAEKDFAAQGNAREFLGEPGLQFIVEEVGAVHQDAGLLPDGVNHGGVAMAEIVDGDAGHEVEVFPAGVVPDRNPRAAHEGKPRRVGGHDELAVKFLGARLHR